MREAKTILQEIGRRGPSDPVLTNAHGRLWGENSLSHRVGKFAEELAIDRSLHDGRGTFATRLRLAGLNAEEIADILGWEKDRVSRILARYVDQARIVTALVKRVAEAEKDG